MLGPSMILGGVPLACTYAALAWLPTRHALAGTALLLSGLELAALATLFLLSR